MTTYPPNAELVAVQWLRSLNLPLVSGVSTSRPSVDRWSDNCWVEVNAMAGSVDVYSQTRNPVVQASVWATPKKFGETNSVAELIQEATYDFAGLNPFPITVSNLPRYPVHLAEVTVWQLPRAIKGDPAKLARTLILLSLVYDIKK